MSNEWLNQWIFIYGKRLENVLYNKFLFLFHRANNIFQNGVFLLLILNFFSDLKSSIHKGVTIFESDILWV